MDGHTIRRASGFFAGLLMALASCAAQEIVLTPHKASGVYDVGEKIEWRVELKGEGAAGAASSARYVLKKGGLTVLREGAIDLASGAGVLETSLDAPGTVLADVKAKVAGKEVRALAGAAVAPEKIARSAPAPDDFDAFWKGKIEELAAVPPDPKIEPADSGKPAVDYYKVQLANIRGTHVYGQLAKPKRDGKFPAMLIVQWAGVYGLPKSNVVPRAEAGWLTLNIMAHDVPFDQPEEFYKKLGLTTLKDYTAIGNDDREKSYFLRMLLGCYRAADYLSQRPDWDGRTLVVTGTSQGGLQSFATAGLHPKVTTMMVNVPAGCDTTATEAGRAFGWPYWQGAAKGKPNEKQIMATSRYFDAVNFASHVKCPALVAIGLIDETSPPSCVFSAYNQLQGPKEVIVMVNSDHHGTKNAQAAYYSRSEAWSRALLQGNSVPPK